MKIRDVPQSGSLALTVTYQSRYGLIRRQKIVGRNPRTPVQMDWRGAFQQARFFWGTFSDEQAAAWDAAGQARRTQSVLGRSSPLPGYLVSVSVNAHLALVGLPMVTEPPAVPVFPASPVVGLVIANTAGTVSLKLQLSGRPVQSVLVYGARPQKPGVRYVDHFPFLGVLPEESGDLVDITAIYLAKHHLLPIGKRVYIQTVQQINGWQDRPNTLGGRVPAS